MPNSTAPSDRPGLRLAYPMDVGGALESHEIPLVVGVLADFGGDPTERPPLRQRYFKPLTADGIARAAACGHANVSSLTTLAELAATDAAIRVLALDVTNDELLADLQTRSDHSVLWRKVYEEQYGIYGGKPFAMIVAGFTVTRSTADVALLDGLARVGADAACPFIISAAPQMFAVEEWDALPSPRQLDSLYASRAFEEWRGLREREYAKFVAVTAPGNAHEVAVSLLRAYTERELWVNSDRLADDNTSGHCDQECAAALRRFGFLPGAIPLREACTIQRPKHFFQPERSAESQSAMHLTSVLTASRFLQAATCMGRDTIGGYSTLKSYESRLNDWLRDYIDGGSDAREADAIGKPLAAGRFELRDVIGAPGKMEVVLELRLTTDSGSPAPSTRLAMLTVSPLNPLGVSTL